MPCVLRDFGTKSVEEGNIYKYVMHGFCLVWQRALESGCDK